MKLKTRELSGLTLDWAVATVHYTDGRLFDVFRGFVRVERQPCHGSMMEFNPTEDWSQGGPIAESSKIWVRFPFGDTGEIEAIHGHFAFPNVLSVLGPTELVARMRCYVLAAKGEEIEVPDWVTT